MRAIVLDEHGRPHPAELPTPDPSVAVLACGLCGSDVEKLGHAAPGTVLGHELVVRTDDGRREALIHHRPCGVCDRCRAGHESTCAQFEAATIVPGGFAERVRPTEGVAIPDGVDDTTATMVEPLACVLRGVERLPAGRVLVVGNGFVGRLFAEVLRRRGDDVYAVDADPRRAGRAPDGAVDAAVVCAKGGVDIALDAVVPGGTVLLFADAGTVPADTIYRRELTVVGSRSATPDSMRAAAALLPELELPEPVVLPLARFDQGLALFVRRDALKVVFVP